MIICYFVNTFLGHSLFRFAPRRSPMRRVGILAIYLLVLIGTPIGHAALLWFHLAAEHSDESATGGSVEVVRALVRSAKPGLDPSSDHPHDEARRTDLARQIGAEPPDDQPSSGLHEHNGFAHSHDDQPASELAQLTGTQSKHYLPQRPQGGHFTIIDRAPPPRSAASHPEIYPAVATPPPKPFG